MNKSYKTNLEECAKNYYSALLAEENKAAAKQDLRKSIKAAISAGESAEHIEDMLSDIALSMC